MSAKATPRFGGGGEKCKTCAETVYPNERISYDNGTWHQLCFKCQSCRSTLSLTAVAMINGDLYCKTCFKKIFMREGKYSTFEKGALPKDVQEKLTHSASMATQGSTGAAGGEQPKPSPVVARSASVSVTSSSAGAGASSGPQTPVAQLQAAVERKDISQCHSLLATHGASLLFEPVKSGGPTLLEWSLTSYLHKSQGVKLIEWLGGAVSETSSVLKQNGLASPLAGKDSGRAGQVEESKESTTEDAEGESSDATTESSEVEASA